MGQKIVVGPFTRGLRNDVEPFNVDTDSFPTLINAYQWRSRIKRKRGTQLVNRLTRTFSAQSLGATVGAQTTYTFNNLFTILGIGAGETNKQINPGSVVINIGAPDTAKFTDNGSGGFTVTGSGVSLGSSINYLTGAVTIVLSASIGGGAITVSFGYFPCLPVMGLESLEVTNSKFPTCVGFDTKYSYIISNASPYPVHGTNFFKNPSPSTSYPGYTQKTTQTSFVFNGQDYQQFWTVNYQGAMWTTNGVPVPFVAATSNIGMQFGVITAIALVGGAPTTTVDITIVGNPLVVGDFIFINEVQGITGINYQSGYVTISGNTFRAVFPNAKINGVYSGPSGIAQYLTNVSDSTKDCIKWMDGDPSGTANGWVNFCPPLSESNFSISDLPNAIYYLVSARMIVPFKDRLIFIGPVVQTSAGNDQVYLQDTIIYSQNGTPYYTCSFDGSNIASVTAPTTTFFPILVPNNQTATAPAYFEDSIGFGGFLSAGLDEAANSVASNEDVLVIGFDKTQTKLIYSSNDIIPFNFYIVNSELGTSSVFSAINLDEGVLSRGDRGYIITNQTSAKRIDLEIPDEVYEISLNQNGLERFCAARDFVNEWIYFTYPINNAQSNNNKFPSATLQFNYRDNSWALFYENYTTYGSFITQSGLTWQTLPYPSWLDWTDSWNSGTNTIDQPQVIGGNQQGFVLFRGKGTGEATSLYIQSFSGNTITSPDHSLNNGDFILITGCIGTIANQVNGKVFQIYGVAQNTFNISPSIGSGTYTGAGYITRYYVPQIQSKEFPVSWQMGRKTRIGMQQYLFSTTQNAQIQLLIFLSQNVNNAYNTGTIVPDPTSTNNSLIYSTVLYTCPESTNLGLTPANINLQMPTAIEQQQIWHRINTSLVGDTIQVGFTLSNDQMKFLTPDGPSSTITGATQATQCVLTCPGRFSIGSMIQINGIVGMTDLNYQSYLNNVYQVVASDATTVTIAVDSTSFSAYISGGTATPVAPIYQTAEIELHGFIIDASPSSLLA